MYQAFVVYFLLMASLIGIWHLAIPAALRPAADVRNEQFVLAVMGIALYTLVLGLRHNVGGDFQGYVGYFDSVRDGVTSADVPFELGFYWLIRVLRYFDLPPTSLFLATCGIQIAFMSAWLRRYPLLASWFLYFFFTTLILFRSLDGVRQALAFSILLYAIPSLLCRNPIKYLALVALAAMFHLSALVFMPLYLAIDRKMPLGRYLQLALMLASYLVADFLKDLLFEVLPLLSVAANYDGYSEVQESLFFESEATGFSLSIAFTLLVNSSLILLSDRLRLLYSMWGFRIYYNIFLVGALLQPAVLAANYIPFARFNYYFDAFKVVILSFLAIWAFTSQDANRWTRAGGVVIVGIYFVWFFIAILKGAAWCAPFQFVFQS